MTKVTKVTKVTKGNPVEPAESAPLTLTSHYGTELYVGPPECDRAKKTKYALPVFAKYAGHVAIYCYLPLSASLAEQEAELREICANLDAEHAQFLAENEA